MVAVYGMKNLMIVRDHRYFELCLGDDEGAFIEFVVQNRAAMIKKAHHGSFLAEVKGSILDYKFDKSAFVIPQWILAPSEVRNALNTLQYRSFLAEVKGDTAHSWRMERECEEGSGRERWERESERIMAARFWTTNSIKAPSSSPSGS
jgi:hypothetical protein